MQQGAQVVLGTLALLFFFMLATACVSMFVSDGSAVAIMIPIGLSIYAYIIDLNKMSALFITTPLVPSIVGADNAFAIWVNDAISIWIEPPIVLVLLCTVPTNLRVGSTAAGNERRRCR